MPWPQEMKNAFLDSQFAAQTVGYRQAFSDAQYFVILPEAGATEAAGRLITHRSDQVLRIVDIALMPNYRNKGLGTRIIHTLQQQARGSGERLQLRVERNSPALRLYLRLGFIRCCEDALREHMEWTPPRPV